MNESTKKNYAVSGYDLLYADHYDTYFANIGSLNRVFGEWRPRNVLVAACGTGIDLLAMRQLGWDCRWFGFDLLSDMVGQAQANLQASGMEAAIWEGDLLEPGFGLAIPIDGFDLAVLRGNSICHLSPEQRAAAVANLYAALGPGGKLLIDYRDGREYFTAEPVVEPLGSGYLADKEVHFVSFYCRAASIGLDEPYQLDAVTVEIGKDGFSIFRHCDLSGYYVLPESMEAAWTAAGFTGHREVTGEVGQSLRCLRTFVVEKGDVS